MARLVLALALVLSFSGAGMASEQGKHAYDMTTNEGSICCESSTVNVEGSYKVVNSEEVKALLENKTSTLLIVDARTPKEFHKAHITGAINIPVEQLEKDVTLLTAPRNASLVFYCNGIKCGKSKKSANIAIGQGYKDVSAYVDGMPVWTEKGYPLLTTPE